MSASIPRVTSVSSPARIAPAKVTRRCSRWRHARRVEQSRRDRPRRYRAQPVRSRHLGFARSAAVGGAAIAKAVGKIIDKGRKIAGYLLEASEQDIEFAAGKFTVSGTDRSMTFGEVAAPPIFPLDGFPLEILEPGLEETAFFDPVNFTFPGGCHVAEVEIDPDPGELALVPTPQSTMSAWCSTR
jgi:hypothetical protein